MKFNEQQILEFARLFDDFISSESVAVQSAFQRLTLLNALARTERDGLGPFEQLVRQMDWLEHELNSMRRDIQLMQNRSEVNMNAGYKIDPGQIINLNMSSSTPNLTASQITAIQLQPLTAADIATITLPHDLP